MSIARDIARSQKNLERALGKPSFTWNGGEYLCTNNSAVAGKQLEPGGFSPESDLVLFARAEQFADDGRPQPKQKLTFRSKAYRIETVSALPGNGLLRISCLDLNQKL